MRKVSFPLVVERPLDDAVSEWKCDRYLRALHRSKLPHQVMPAEPRTKRAKPVKEKLRQKELF